MFGVKRHICFSVKGSWDELCVLVFLGEKLPWQKWLWILWKTNCRVWTEGERSTREVSLPSAAEREEGRWSQLAETSARYFGQRIVRVMACDVIWCCREPSHPCQKDQIKGNRGECERSFEAEQKFAWSGAINLCSSWPKLIFLIGTNKKKSASRTNKHMSIWKDFFSIKAAVTVQEELKQVRHEIKAMCH